jgi:hypothetical protein
MKSLLIVMILVLIIWSVWLSVRLNHLSQETLQYDYFITVKEYCNVILAKQILDASDPIKIKLSKDYVLIVKPYQFRVRPYDFTMNGGKLFNGVKYIYGQDPLGNYYRDLTGRITGHETIQSPYMRPNRGSVIPCLKTPLINHATFTISPL